MFLCQNTACTQPISLKKKKTAEISGENSQNKGNIKLESFQTLDLQALITVSVPFKLNDKTD